MAVGKQQKVTPVSEQLCPNGEMACCSIRRSRAESGMMSLLANFFELSQIDNKKPDSSRTVLLVWTTQEWVEA
jgi:hypothetical protein